jgi:hypothetical protein
MFAVAKTLHFDPAHKRLKVATPVLAAHIVEIAGLIAAWAIEIDRFAATLLLGCVLGLAGASFAVAQPPRRWSRHHGWTYIRMDECRTMDDIPRLGSRVVTTKASDIALFRMVTPASLP